MKQNQWFMCVIWAIGVSVMVQCSIFAMEQVTENVGWKEWFQQKARNFGGGAHGALPRESKGKAEVKPEGALDSVKLNKKRNHKRRTSRSSKKIGKDTVGVRGQDVVQWQLVPKDVYRRIALGGGVSIVLGALIWKVRAYNMVSAIEERNKYLLYQFKDRIKLCENAENYEDIFYSYFYKLTLLGPYTKKRIFKLCKRGDRAQIEKYIDIACQQDIQDRAECLRNAGFMGKIVAGLYADIKRF